jgi:two-component system, LytTR family, response regulator
MKQPKIIAKIPNGNTIILMESDSNYTIIYLSDGRQLISGYNLKFYENCTDNQVFVRPNRSMIINKIIVAGINIEDSSLMLTDGRKINISRRRMKDFQILT